MKFLTLLVIVACAAVGCHSFQAPPPLPTKYTAWVVVSSESNQTGKETLVSNWAGTFQLDQTQNAACAIAEDLLHPGATFVSFLNASTGKVGVSNMLNGTSTSCELSPMSGPMPNGGGATMAPSLELMMNMKFFNYTIIDNVNCSMYYVMTTEHNNKAEHYWAVRNDNQYPALYIHSYIKNGFMFTATAAYVGQMPFNGHFSGQCPLAGTCVSEVCIANRASSPDQLGGALAWACGDGGVNCTAINQGGDDYYPNTVQAHCDYAFNAYYYAHRQQGPGACAFNGAGNLVLCDKKSCNTCKPKSNVSESALQAAMTWVCGDQGIQNCSAIQPGGAHFTPNNTIAHATWAFTKYYDAYHCVPEADACDFGGVAEVVSC